VKVTVVQLPALDGMLDPLESKLPESIEFAATASATRASACRVDFIFFFNEGGRGFKSVFR
jgi:hypothetical protein